MEKKIHQGKNISRFRQMLGMKQDLLASIMGDDWTQLKISRLEAKNEIEEGILDEVARALKIPVEAIKNFDEETAISIVANTFTDFKDNAVASAMNYYPSFNPVDKIVEILEQANKEKNEEIAFLRKEIEELKKAKK
ncbi:XRE family transcriptional regulator [Flavihumibacter cheonanensis]|jgi:transcriptional regulator with XRE-family HTH domain|uniref:XRE family transcriptional regulator n=1 Tax=Flavihumibacter cheonanensis TaxID=1442385 RepID=UPI001EF844CF|nr:XRE family transcriptional regulator [Flavihumibacter cheonanensis]MCG7752896.1 XRE family transcriptional regulator [Flavihumibacter cheonanensis]